MELKDLKPNDLVSFTLGDKKIHKGIFKQTDEWGYSMFVLTDMWYENQCFDDTLFNLVDLLSRPAITDNYDYIKERLKENRLNDIDEEIEMLKQEKKAIRRNFVPRLNDVLNYTEEEYY